MKDFKTFRDVVAQKLQSMPSVFKAEVDSDKLWEVYLDSFPEGTNELYRTNREYDCSCCRHFVKHYGGLVTIMDHKMVSIWDVEIGYPFTEVAAALSREVKRQGVIKDIFRSNEITLGTTSSFGKDEVKYEHFSASVPDCATTSHRDPDDHKVLKQVFLRALVEFTPEAISTVLEMIEEGTLYRGAEHKAQVLSIQSHKQKFDELTVDQSRDFYVWEAVDLAAIAAPSTLTIRNTSLGTLLTNLSTGMPTGTAVSKYESMTAPLNYRRPVAKVTAQTLAKFKETLACLGLDGSFERKFATQADLPFDDALYLNNHVELPLSALEELEKDIPLRIDSLERKAVEISAAVFFENIVPNADSMQLLMQSSLKPNLLSIIAPENPEAQTPFKWDNSFSWAYNGDVTDSIRDRVKKAGGNVNVFLRCSLAWFNTDDLDIHIKEPNRNVINFGSKVSHNTGGVLDVDMNVGEGDAVEDAVENIRYTDKKKMIPGEYAVIIHNYTHRNNTNVGCEVEFAVNQKALTYKYDQRLIQGEKVNVFSFFVDAHGEVNMSYVNPLCSIGESTITSEQVWGLGTNKFVDVTAILPSPNYWGTNKNGAKHLIFLLKNCINPNQPRGFFNEYLKSDLDAHRKTLEALGAKSLVPKSDDQLSGVGFSYASDNNVIVKANNDIFKVKF